METYRGIIGIIFIIGLLWRLSYHRTHIRWKLVLQGFLIQLLLLLCVLYIPFLKSVLKTLSQGILVLKKATQEGTQFVFGYVGGGQFPSPVEDMALVHVFAFQILPFIIVVSAFSMLLFHYGILTRLIHILSPFFRRVLHIGGAMGVVASAKLFLSQMESPMIIRPYLKDLTRTELLMLMACGMSTTSAAAIPLYACILQETLPHVIDHIIIASLLGIPCSITLSRILLPDLQNQKTEGAVTLPYQFHNGIDALSKGAIDGMTILWHIVSILIVFTAGLYMVNHVTESLTQAFFGSSLTVQSILGYVLYPFMWILGIPSSDCIMAGSLLGTKTLLNEVVAFVQFSSSLLTSKSQIIMMYVLCGFANFSSVGMVIASLGGLCPERQTDIVYLAPRALLIGTLSSCINGALMGLFL